MPGERDERLRGRKTITVTEPEPDEYELYDLTLDPLEERNLAHPSHATDDSRRLQETMFELLTKQLSEKRLVPRAGELPGYRPPQEACQSRCRRLTRPKTCGDASDSGWASILTSRRHEPRRSGP